MSQQTSRPEWKIPFVPSQWKIIRSTITPHPSKQDLLEHFIQSCEKKQTKRAIIVSYLIFVFGWEREWWRMIVEYHCKEIGWIRSTSWITDVIESYQWYCKVKQQCKNYANNEDDTIINTNEGRHIICRWVQSIINLSRYPMKLNQVNTIPPTNITHHDILSDYEILIQHHTEIYTKECRKRDTMTSSYLRHCMNLWRTFWYMYHTNSFQTTYWASYMNDCLITIERYPLQKINVCNAHLLGFDYKKIPKRYRDHPIWNLWLFIHSKMPTSRLKEFHCAKDMILYYLKWGGTINHSAFKRWFVESCIWLQHSSTSSSLSSLINDEEPKKSIHPMDIHLYMQCNNIIANLPTFLHHWKLK